MKFSSATFSRDRTYRYSLIRRWALGDEVACFIMLNPSTADEEQDDPSVRRCIGYAKAWGYPAVRVLNIFGLRSTDPISLYRVRDPVGPDNLNWIRKLAPEAALVVCAWGNHGELRGQGDLVLRLLREAGVKPHALRMTKAGQPGHPLYLPRDLKPVPL